MKDLRAVRLLEERLHALILATKAINSILDPQKVLEMVVESALTAFPTAQRGSIHLYDEEVGLLRLVITRYDYSLDDREALSFRTGEGIAGWVYEHNQPIVIPNAQEHPRYKRIVHPDVPSHKSKICVPLRVKDKVIGVLTLNNLQLRRKTDPVPWYGT